MNKKWLLYGATGFTGKLILEKAIQKGVKPVIGGRNKEKVEALAAQFDCESVVFEAQDASKAIKEIEDLQLVLNCAGPFIRTYQFLVEACLEHQVHYLDITGEWVVLEGIRQLHEEAVKQNIMLMPAVGFDVVPTDCMSLKLSQQIDSPVTLKLAFAGLGSASRGTVKSGLYHLPGGNKIRKDGELLTVPQSKDYVVKNFEGNQFKMIVIPWGDIVTAYHTTGIPNISVRTAFPSKMLKFLPLMNIIRPLLGLDYVQRFLANMVDKKLPEGPDQNQRKKSVTYVNGKVFNQQGESAELTWKMPEGYTLTAITSVEIVQKILQNNFKPGFQTPAGLYGYEWFLSLEGVKVLPG